MEQILIADNLVKPPDIEMLNFMCEAVTEAASRCRLSDDRPENVIQQLDLKAAMEDFSPDMSRELLFNTANAFGAIDIDQSWQALMASCDALQPLSSPLRQVVVAFGSRDLGWTSFQLVAADMPVLLLDESNGYLAEISESTLVKFGILGFEKGAMRHFAACENMADRNTKPVSKTELLSYMQAQSVLFLGLITGASKRIVDEAFAYARQRKSGGCVIAHHQAVALRLADLAINHRALSLFAQTLVEEMKVDGDPSFKLTLSAADHISDLAFQIARDSMQTAAGHGYVSGLPFRLTFEKLRTLSTLLSKISEQLVFTEGNSCYEKS